MAIARTLRISVASRLVGGGVLSLLAVLLATCTSDHSVAPQVASRLAFTTEPTSSLAGAVIGPEIKVEARDATGTGLTGTLPEPAIAGVASFADLTGATLSGTKTVAAISGVATFSNLSIDLVGSGYRLTETSSGLTSVTTTAFSIQ